MKHLYDSENVLITSSVQEMCQREMGTGREEEGGEEGDGDWQIMREKEQKSSARQIEQEKTQTLKRDEDTGERGYVSCLIKKP